MEMGPTAAMKITLLMGMDDVLLRDAIVFNSLG
jgi:hypothetical protein